MSCYSLTIDSLIDHNAAEAAIPRQENHSFLSFKSRWFSSNENPELSNRINTRVMKYTFANYSFDELTQGLRRPDGSTCRLRPKVSSLLAIFLNRPSNELISKED